MQPRLSSSGVPQAPSISLRVSSILSSPFIWDQSIPFHFPCLDHPITSCSNFGVTFCCPHRREAALREPGIPSPRSRMSNLSLWSQRSVSSGHTRRQTIWCCKKGSWLQGQQDAIGTNSMLGSVAGSVLVGKVSQGFLPTVRQLGAGRPDWTLLSPRLYKKWLAWLWGRC